MDLYPAIDVRGGSCVRLVQGDYGQETVYRADPVAVAKEFEASGATWLHVVDLDAARTGQPENRDVVAAIARSVGVPVQSGGGVRDEKAAEALFAAGVTRVVIGTAALEDPDLVRALAARHPGGVAVGLDGRGGEAATRGWTEDSGIDVLDAIDRFEGAGVAAFVVTDIDRDGMLGGPDLAGLAAVLARTAVPIIASGGVSSLDDLRALARLGAAGAIVGKAIYEGVFTVEEGLAACAPSG
jgi:phosphoribosylformimino-5-aminoimidazole carboxamide ribotide isomerase